MTGIVSTIIGNGIWRESGDGGLATAASIFLGSGICFDKSQNLYIGTHGCRVRKLDAMTGIITRYAGSDTFGGFSGDGGPATNAHIHEPYGICMDNAGNLFIADRFNAKVRRVDALTGIITTFAGTDTAAYNGDGLLATAANIMPMDVAMDNTGNLLIAEVANSRIRKVDVIDGRVYTIAGTGVRGFSGDGGRADSAQISDITGIVVDDCNNIYLNDLINYRIRKITYSYCNYLSVPETISNETGLSIYPNPATEELHINDVRSSCSYMLYNTLGQTAAGGDLKQGNNTVVMKYLSPGLYVLYITDEAGRKQVHRVVKGN
jgi:hypothetical protein